jgi:ADP-ribosylglycohydrolase
MSSEPSLRDQIRGMLLGAALGDALGLPREGLTPQRAARLFKGPLRHRLLAGRGMVSDDTDHLVMVAQALLASGDDPDRFAQRLAWSLRWWLMALPAGVGMATGRAIIKLWFGFSSASSGVWSAGNGPAMRVAPIAAAHFDNPERLIDFVQRSTRMTHSDPKAQTGALAVARVCSACLENRWPTGPNATQFGNLLGECGDDDDWKALIQAILEAVEENPSVPEFARVLGQGKGVSGYMYHSVPVALFAWYRHFGDYAETIEATIACGGDTDTVAAIAGAMAGSVCGERGISSQWIEGIVDWPNHPVRLRNLADCLCDARDCGIETAPLRVFWPLIPLRNLFFLLVVLTHGFRRLLPPY